MDTFLSVSSIELTAYMAEILFMAGVPLTTTTVDIAHHRSRRVSGFGYIKAA
jgi:hypothetical protein